MEYVNCTKNVTDNQEWQLIYSAQSVVLFSEVKMQSFQYF